MISQKALAGTGGAGPWNSRLFGSTRAHSPTSRAQSRQIPGHCCREEKERGGEHMCCALHRNPTTHSNPIWLQGPALALPVGSVQSPSLAPFFSFGLALLGLGWVCVSTQFLCLNQHPEQRDVIIHSLTHSLTQLVVFLWIGGLAYTETVGRHSPQRPSFFFFFRTVRTAKRSECSFFLPSLAFLLGCAGSQERRERGEREPSLVSRTVWKISGGCRCASTAS